MTTATQPTSTSITDVLNKKDALSLLLLSRINFNSGIDMMRRLRLDEKQRSQKTEESISPHSQAADEFARYAPEQYIPQPLDISSSLVVASLILSRDIGQEGGQLDFIKSGIRTPKQVIEAQMDWMADNETKQRQMQAQKFGRDVSADKFKAEIKAKQHEQLVSFITEAQGSVIDTIKQADSEALVDYIETAYFVPTWEKELQDSAIGLYESAIKRIDAGKWADLPDEVIDYAVQALDQRKEQHARLKAVA